MKYTHWALKFSNYDQGKVHTKHKLHRTREDARLSRRIYLDIYAKKVGFSEIEIKVIKVNSQPIECADDAERVI